MNDEITIVSAFFDIGRGDMKCFARTSQLYFEYFTKWAKMKNKMIIYVGDEEMKNKIISFRNKLGLTDRTEVILIDEIKKFEPQVFYEIEMAVNNKTYQNYRLRPQNPESYSAMYNYIMVLKARFIEYTVTNLGYEGQIAWMDFGFNHGGQVYSLESDFSIEWKYDFGDKITLFNLKPLDERPIFDIVFSMDTYIMGSIIVVPSYLAKTFWDLTKDNIKAMSSLGLADDDQIFWLLALRMNPEIVSAKKVSDWHTALKEYGCYNLIYKSAMSEFFLKKYLRKIRHLYECICYAKRIFSVAYYWTQQ